MLSSEVPVTSAGPSIGPIRHSLRSLAPDMARGGVLLGIALANVSLYLYGSDMGAGHRPADGSALARTLDFLVTLVVNDRSRPMFALLFGFGLATMARRMTERGVGPRARTAVLVRRNLWLIGFGAVHAALLFEGDILGVYGATGLIVLLLLARRPRVLVVWGTVSAILLAVVVGFAQVSFEASTAPSDYLASVVPRLALFSLGLGIGSILMFMVTPMLIGVAMARAGLLDSPADHVPLLRRLAGGGVSIGLLGGLPLALVVAGLWEPATAVTVLVGGVHALSGLAMGVGYVSLFALWAARRESRADRQDGPAARTGVAAVLAAVGERSLTCYLLQSVMLAPLLSPWGLGLGNGLGSAQAYGIAVAVWLVTVAVACALAAAGRRGPFEVLLRRLTYGPAPAGRRHAS